MLNNFSNKELGVLAHALRAEIERIERSGGGQYGELSLPEARCLLERVFPTGRDQVLRAVKDY